MESGDGHGQRILISQVRALSLDYTVSFLKGCSFTEVLDDYLATVNTIWEKEKSVSLIRYVFIYFTPAS